MNNYRSELDGIRGISIIAVLFYHLDLNTFHFSNGYLGVDVFLVLSGYLISRNIIRELRDNGKLNLSTFFEKRTRRILPLLVTLTLFCQILFYFYLLPDQLIDLAKSSLAALTLTSNFYWVNEFSEYSAVGASFRPLLHTWSLSLEEQFYITAPFFYILAFKREKSSLLKVLILITIAGVSTNTLPLIFSWGGDLDFYLYPFRIWQFAIGAIAAYLECTKKDLLLNLKARLAATLTSLLILLATLFLGRLFLENEHLARLTVTLSSFLLIIASREGMLVTSLLKVKPLTYIGLFSYSIYVWHYPLFFLARIKEFFTTPSQKIVVVAITLLIATVSYFCLENVFRNREKIKKSTIYMSLAFGFIVSIALSMFIIINRGYPERFGQFHYTIDQMHNDQQRYWDENSYFTDIDWEDQKRLKVVVIGNSYALDIATAIKHEDHRAQVLFEGKTEHHCISITLPGSNEQADKCLDNIPLFKKDYKEYDVIVITDNHSFLDIGNTQAVDEILKNVSYLRTSGFQGPIVLVGFRPEWDKTPFEIALNYGALDEGVNIFATSFLTYSPEQIRELDENAKKVYNIEGLFYFELVDTICKIDHCPIIKDQKLLYSDSYHFSLAGAHYISKDLVDYLFKVAEQHKKN